MHVDDFYEVSALVKERQTLLSNRDLVAEHDRDYLGVTINGTYQDQEMVREVRDTVLRVIDTRVHLLNMKLIDLGVSPSARAALPPEPPPAAPEVRQGPRVDIQVPRFDSRRVACAGGGGEG